jgi:putative tricarboxylic transport membrane protein
MAPLVLALVLGPLLEKSFRQTVIGSQGDVTEFITRPISGVLLAAALVLFLSPFVRMALGRDAPKVQITE